MTPLIQVDGPEEWLPLGLRCAGLCLLLWMMTASQACASSPWEKPATELSEQIAAILGPGQSQLLMTNRSTIAPAEVVHIRSLLEQSLLEHGVHIAATENANMIRVTLSENMRERIWVAEVMEGNQVQVTMVRLDRDAAVAAPAETGLILQKKRVWSSKDSPSSSIPSDEPVLSALELPAALIVLERDRIVVVNKTASAGSEEKRFNLNAGNEQRRPLARDPQGILTPAFEGRGFIAFTGGAKCTGRYGAPTDMKNSQDAWSVDCEASDDPWPVAAVEGRALRVFYNPARNYFTGVIAPAYGVDLAPFYSVAFLIRSTADQDRSSPSPLLVNSLNGKTQLVEQGTVKAVSGTRDWGSDFAVIHTGCGSGTQIVASGSGEAVSDSVRAYELSGQEAVAASAPLEMGGAVTALWVPQDGQDGANAWTVVHTHDGAYEVDRVTALCP